MGVLKRISLFLFLLISHGASRENIRGDLLFDGSFNRYVDRCEQLYLKSTAVTVVSFDRIAKALRTSGYRLMPKFLAANLKHVVPYCAEDHFFFFFDRRSRFTIFSLNATVKPTVTLFVPRDEAIRVQPPICLDAQIVPAKWEKEDFAAFSPAMAFGNGEGIYVEDRFKYSGSYYYRFNRFVPVERPGGGDRGSVVIGGARVTMWNIYNDGHIIVHGTDDFFNDNLDWPWPRRFDFEINTAQFERFLKQRTQ